MMDSALTLADQNDVILLQRPVQTKTTDQILDEAKKQKENPASVKTLPTPPLKPVGVGGAASGALSPNPKSRDQEMGRDYALTLYTSLCADSYQNEFNYNRLNDAERPDLWRHIQSSCQCMGSEILGLNIDPVDLTNFVMYSYGWRDADKSDPQLAAWFGTSAAQVIGQVNRNPALRKKCGFLN
jgi:hypothetical protein